MVEDFGASVIELLVASDVKIYWSICKYLWSLYKDQAHLTSTHWQTIPPLYSKCIVGKNQYRLHCKTPKVHRVWYDHNSYGLSIQDSVLHFHPYSGKCQRSSKTLPAPYVEAL